MPRSSRGCARPARSSSASSRCTNSRSAAPPSTCRFRRRATRGTPSHHPGGSSSGSGAALAAGLVPLALGTDTGGSIRNPAGACGVVGLKPTYGLVSRRGVFPLAFTLDHVGPMARSVADIALAARRARRARSRRIPAAWRPPRAGSGPISAAACAACASASSATSTRRTCPPIPRSRPRSTRSRRVFEGEGADVRTVTLPSPAASSPAPSG